MIRRGQKDVDRDPRTPPRHARDDGEGSSDRDLARRAGEGCADALEELVRRHLPQVHRVLLRLLSDREAAADATQEVFLRLQRHIPRFDPTRSLRPWLYTIVWNVARDELRRRGRRSCVEIPSSSSGPGEPADPSAQAPSEALEVRERGEWVRSALARIDPRQRALLLLREAEGLSHDVLARMLGCPTGTVKSRLHRARCALRAALEALRPGELRSLRRPPGPRGARRSDIDDGSAPLLDSPDADREAW